MFLIATLDVEPNVFNRAESKAAENEGNCESAFDTPDMLYDDETLVM